MEEYIILILWILIVWFLGTVGYKILTLFYLWIKYKFENIKIKEYSLWD